MSKEVNIKSRLTDNKKKKRNCAAPVAVIVNGTKHTARGLHVSCLPPEILAIIFGNLQVQHRGTVAMVCVAWRDAVYQKLIWCNMTIKLRSRKNIDVDVLLSLSARGIKRVTMIGNWVPKLTEVLGKVGRGFPTLDSLDLTNCYSFGDKTINESISLPFPVLTVLNLCHCTRLTDPIIDIVVRKLPTLVDLDLTGSKLLHDISMLSIAVNLKLLRSLNLFGCLKLTDGGIGYLAGWDETRSATYPSIQLDSLTIYGCERLTDTSLYYLSAGQSNLKSFNMSYIRGFTHEGLEMVTTGMTKLETLICSSSPLLTDGGMQLMSKLPRLKTIDLTCLTHPSISWTGIKHLTRIATLVEFTAGHSSFDDVEMRYLTTGACRLVRLSFVRCSNVTDNGLRHLATVSSLRYLDITHCRCVSSTGLTYLAEGEAKLQQLTIKECGNIGSDGLLEISKGMFHLRRLCLSSRHYDEEGVTLAARNLKELYHFEYGLTNRICEIYKRRRQLEKNSNPEIAIEKPPKKRKKKGGILPRMIFA